MAKQKQPVIHLNESSAGIFYTDTNGDIVSAQDLTGDQIKAIRKTIYEKGYYLTATKEILELFDYPQDCICLNAGSVIGPSEIPNNYAVINGIKMKQVLDRIKLFENMLFVEEDIFQKTFQVFNVNAIYIRGVMENLDISKHNLDLSLLKQHYKVTHQSVTVDKHIRTAKLVSKLHSGE